MGKHTDSFEDVFGEETSKLIYLSPDAPEPLHTIEEDKIYVIGGIADTHIIKVSPLHWQLLD